MGKIKNPRVCVIGAGVGGLSTARYLKAEGINFNVLEATRYVGGTWRYDPRVDYDENGLPLHTSMYKHLHTNLPKPTMELPGFPIPDDAPSFPSWKDYYKYLQAYAKHFDLEKHIQFLHIVVSVKRVENCWRIKHKHVLTGEEFEEEYDYVVVSTGHHSKPRMPSIEGEEKFKGTIIHSHSYRITEPYKCRRVLIVGAGPSGMDISLALTEVSSRVVHSHHSIVNFRTPFPENYVRKPDVKELNETGAFFVDGTFEELDDIIYCTGYEYDYPFIDESCGLTITKRSVIPLYKYMLNINQPTFVMLGLVVRACIVLAMDAQARYTTALIKGNFSLPTHEEMMADWQRRYDALRSQSKPLSHIHLLAEKEDEYYAELTHESGIERVPPVMFRIRALDTQAKLDNLLTYRHYSYKILDSENFTRIMEEKSSEYKKFDKKNCIPYTTALIKGNFSLPTHEEMMADWQRRYDALRSQSKPLSHIHLLAEKEDEYYAELTHESGIERVPPVMFRIRALDTQAKLDNLLTYRHYSYKILDSENFTRIMEEKSSEYKKFDKKNCIP